MEMFYTNSQIAKKLGLSVHTLKYWLSKWQIDETMRIGCVRVYDGKKFRQIQGMVAAAPRKAGKTLFAQTLTTNFAKQDVMSLWFSYELSSREFINRFPGELPVFTMPSKLKANSLDWLGSALLRGWSSMA